MSVAGFIAIQRVEHGVPHATSCRALGMSQAWFYKWCHGDPWRRHARRACWRVKIKQLFVQHRGRYGSPRITADLRDAGGRRAQVCSWVNWTRRTMYTQETIEFDSAWGTQHSGVLENFAANIQDGTPLIAPGSDGINGVRLANAIHLSSWTGKEVSLDFDEDDYLAELNKRIREEGTFPER